MKWNPPQIERTLPAFCNKDGKTILTVPFTMNKTVSINSVNKMAIRIKTINSNQLVYTGETELNLNDLTQVAFEIQKDGFYSPYEEFIIGEYYKVQIAYIEKDSNEKGYYSTVGIIKFTTSPQMYIDGMREGEVHADRGYYTGIFTNAGGDITEKLYTYYFSLYDANNNLITTTGETIHNYEEDTEVNLSTDKFQLIASLEENKIYTLQYGGTTTNGMKLGPFSYKIVQQSTIDPEIKCDVVAEMNRENGYVQIKILGKVDENTKIETSAIGTFQIVRSSEIGKFIDWKVIHRFVMFGSQPSLVDIKDFTVEQGKKYRYGLQQYNNDTGLVSNKILSNDILVDFEDCFLYDGKRQLKIKYNPKISSFKETLLESKTNTLGEKYPFVFRNGKVSYKEFPISGLISYLMDEEHLFLSDEEMGIENFTQDYYREVTLKPNITSKDIDYFNSIRENSMTQAENLFSLYSKREVSESNENQIAKQKIRTTQLVDYNRAAERIFKLKVLEFLNDGKPKLFRSSAEGNYIVRLTNSSLSPNDQLGRMLHSFSTTATEIHEFTPEKLNELGITTTEEIDTKQLRWETKLLKDFQNTPPNDQGWIQINNYTATSIQCQDMLPGTKIRLTLTEGLEQKKVEIVIGITGSYFSELGEKIEKIEIHPDIFNITSQGQITYGFYGKTFNKFDTYQSFEINDIPVIQFIGEKYKKEKNEAKGIKDYLTDIRNKIIGFNLLHFVKRETLPIYGFIDNEGNEHYYNTLNLELEDININYPTQLISLQDFVFNKNGVNIPENFEEIVDEDFVNKAKIALGGKYSGKWYRFLNTFENGINELRCQLHSPQSVYLYYKTNLNPNEQFMYIDSQSVFVLNKEHEIITEWGIGISKTTIGTIAIDPYLNLKKEDFSNDNKMTFFNPLVVYQIVNQPIDSNTYMYLDGNTKERIIYSNKIKIDNSEVDITDIEEYQVSLPDEVNEVQIPTGVIADIGIQCRIITYGIENTTQIIKELKNLWLKWRLLLFYWLYGQNMTPSYPTSMYPSDNKYIQDGQPIAFLQAVEQAEEDLNYELLNSSYADLVEGTFNEEEYIKTLVSLKQQEKNAYNNYAKELSEQLEELAKGGTQ